MRQELIAYPAIRSHALIGDRRTGALVAGDGTIDWMCLTRFDGMPLFAALLDVRRGGHFRVGPALLRLGDQRYDTPGIVTTRWHGGGGILELTDALAWESDDDARPGHVILRRLRCTAGEVICAASLRARAGFNRDLPLSPAGELDVPGLGSSRLWSSAPVFVTGGRLRAHVTLRAGDTWWLVLEIGGRRDWSEDAAETLLARTAAAWRRLSARTRYDGEFADEVRHACMAVHLLTDGRVGSVVAAATTSLPERIGGDWNADYRLTWVRDASLAMAMLARVGDLPSAAQFMDFLSGVRSETDMPLQVAYRPDGEPGAAQRRQRQVHGYRGSRPVHFGNHAYSQMQLDSAGFLLECAHTYAEHGGRLSDEFRRLLCRAVEAHARRWREPDHSIWELPVAQHYVSGKVMSWAALDRACRLGAQLADDALVAEWRGERDTIREDVLANGWSDRLGAFRQRYEADTLDAAALLIPLVGLLPADDPRVTATIDRLERDLTLDGFVYRFIPDEVPGIPKLALGEFEGAFLPTTFWMAAVRALRGEVGAAQHMIQRVARMAGGPGLLPEAIDARSATFAGNTPLAFSHVELVRAALSIDAVLRAGRSEAEGIGLG